jgi:hypothetical protein
VFIPQLAGRDRSGLDDMTSDMFLECVGNTKFDGVRRLSAEVFVGHGGLTLQEATRRLLTGKALYTRG